MLAVGLWIQERVSKPPLQGQLVNRLDPSLEPHDGQGVALVNVFYKVKKIWKAKKIEKTQVGHTKFGERKNTH